MSEPQAPFTLLIHAVGNTAKPPLIKRLPSEIDNPDKVRQVLLASLQTVTEAGMLCVVVISDASGFPAWVSDNSPAIQRMKQQPPEDSDPFSQFNGRN